MNYKHRRPTFSTDEVIAYGRTLIGDKDFNEILDALSVDALAALATAAPGTDPMPQLHLIYKRDDGRIEHHVAQVPIPEVDIKYELFATLGHGLGQAAQHRLAAVYLLTTAWFSGTPGTLPEHAPDRQEAITVSGLAFDGNRHNLYMAHYSRDEAGKPRVTSEKTLHYGSEGAAKWSANKLLQSLVRGFARGVIDQVSPNRTH